MLLRPFLNDAGSRASSLFGCMTHNGLAVLGAHADLVDGYLASAAAIGSATVAVFETLVRADRVSGLPALVERTGATAYLPRRSTGRVRPCRAGRRRPGRAWEHGRDRGRDAGSCARAQRVHGHGSAAG